MIVGICQIVRVVMMFDIILICMTFNVSEFCDVTDLSDVSGGVGRLPHKTGISAPLLRTESWPPISFIKHSCSIAYCWWLYH